MFFYRFELGSPLMVIGFFIGMFAGAVWLAYLYNRTGSIFVVILWHSFYNVAVALAALFSSTVVATVTSLVMLLALVALLFGGSRRLGLDVTSSSGSRKETLRGFEVVEEAR